MLTRSRPAHLLAGLFISLLACALLLTVTTGSAAAHDPIFLTADQTSPETGPYLPDGTISFALYGTLQEPGDTRGFEFELRDGDDLYLSLLIPDIEPEISLAEDLLPTMELIEPDGSSRAIAPEIRDPFADPYSGTNYLTLFETIEQSGGGRYQVVVTGETPSRFTVAVGTSEQFFTVVERTVDKPSSFPEIAAPLGVWYSTPAGEAPSSDPAASVDMDLDLIDEDLAALDEQTDDGVPPEVATRIAEEAAATEAAPEAEDGMPEDADVEPDAESNAEPETAAGDPGDGDADDDGGGLGFVAPVVVLAAIGGAGLWMMRRRNS